MMTAGQHVLSGAFPRVAARRESPRLRVEDVVQVHVTTPSSIVAVRIRDLSFDGLLLETSTPVVPGTRARLEFETDEAFIVTLPAIAIHGRVADPGRQTYLSGWEFLGDDTTDAAVNVLMKAILHSA